MPWPWRHTSSLDLWVFALAMHIHDLEIQSSLLQSLGNHMVYIYIIVRLYSDQILQLNIPAWGIASFQSYFSQQLMHFAEFTTNRLCMLSASWLDVNFEWKGSHQKSELIRVHIDWNLVTSCRISLWCDVKSPDKFCSDSPEVALCKMDSYELATCC